MTAEQSPLNALERFNPSSFRCALVAQCSFGLPFPFQTEVWRETGLPPIVTRTDMATTERACIICLDTSPPPIQSGCACRGDGGLAHVDCLVQLAASQQAHRGRELWWQCQTCQQDFTGAMRTGLAEARRSRVANQAAENDERL
jgi:hypothetical protein